PPSSPYAYRLPLHDALPISEVARERGGDPRDVAMDLVREDESRVGMIVFIGARKNLLREAALPWMSFGSDAGSSAPEGVFLKSQDRKSTRLNSSHVSISYAV